MLCTRRSDTQQGGTNQHQTLQRKTNQHHPLHEGTIQKVRHTTGRDKSAPTATGKEKKTSTATGMTSQNQPLKGGTNQHQPLPGGSNQHQPRQGGTNRPQPHKGVKTNTSYLLTCQSPRYTLLYCTRDAVFHVIRMSTKVQEGVTSRCQSLSIAVVARTCQYCTCRQYRRASTPFHSSPSSQSFFGLLLPLTRSLLPSRLCPLLWSHPGPAPCSSPLLPLSSHLVPSGPCPLLWSPSAPTPCSYPLLALSPSLVPYGPFPIPSCLQQLSHPPLSIDLTTCRTLYF